jgi:cell division protein FtsA
MCEEIVKLPVRLASPTQIAEMPPQLAEPEFATVVGLAMYAHRTTVGKVTEIKGFASQLRALFAKLGA